MTDSSLPREAQALLDAISAEESPGYDVIYGGSRFSDFSKHPGIYIPIKSGPNAGKLSSAAGRYQFLESTWEEAAAATGATDFSPAAQDKAAWWLAQRDYRTRTGSDLLTDLQAGEHGKVRRNLAATWEGLGLTSDDNFGQNLANGGGPRLSYAASHNDVLGETPRTTSFYEELWAEQDLRRNRGSYLGALGGAFADAWSPSGLNHLGHKYLWGDRNFMASDEMIKQAIAAGVPESEAGNLAATYSQDHFDYTVNRIKSSTALQTRLAGWGWGGKAAGVMAEITSPEMLAAVGISILSEGAATPLLWSTRTGRLANIARGATAGAIGNLAGDAAFSAMRDDDFTTDEAWESLFLGMGIGAIAGGFRKTSLIEESEALARAARTGADEVVKDAEIAAGARQPDPAPEVQQAPAAVPGAPVSPPRAPTAFTLADDDEVLEIIDELGSTAGARRVSSDDALFNELADIRDADAIGGALSAADPRLAKLPEWARRLVRWSMTGQVAGSFNPASRATYRAFMPDNVGRIDGGAVDISAWEVKTTLRNTWLQSFQPKLRASFDEWKTRQGLSFTEGELKRREFNAAITKAVREKDASKLAKYDPEVLKAADEWRKLTSTIRENLQNPRHMQGGQGRAVRGMENVQDNPNYIPRVIDYDRIGKIVEKFGDANVASFLAKAFQSANPLSDPDFAFKLSRGWLLSAQRRGYGAEEPFSLFVGSGDFEALRMGLEDLQDHLRHLRSQGVDVSDALMTQDEMEQALRKLQGSEDDAGKASRAKMRTTFDENYRARVGTKMGTSAEELSFADFLVNDFEQLAGHYVNWASGASALGGMRVFNPSDPNELLIDGITSKADFDRFIGLIRRTGANTAKEKGLSPTEAAKQIQRDVDIFTKFYKAIAGIPVNETGTGLLNSAEAQQWMRRLSDIQFIRVMNQAGLSAIPEVMNVFSSVTTKAFFSQIPALSSYISKVKTGEWSDDLSREVQSFIGTGGEPYLSRMAHHLGEAAGDPFAPQNTVTDGLKGKLDAGLHYGKQATSWVSGLRPITEFTQMAATRMVLQNIADAALTVGSVAGLKHNPIKGLDKTQFRSLNLEDAQVDRIFAAIRKYAKTTPNPDGGVDLKLLNLDQWVGSSDELAARYDLIMGVQRMARRAIQENDPGLMAQWMTANGMHLVTQFKSFMMGAYEKQLLHNIHVWMDGETARAQQYFLTTGLAAALGYITTVQLRAAGREDRDEYLDRMLTKKAIAGAVVARSSWGSLIPGVIDSVADPIFGTKLFDSYRSTGLNSRLFSLDSIPTGQFINDTYQFLNDFRESSFEGRDMSGREFRNGFSLLPFQNVLPLTWALTHMVADRPDAARGNRTRKEVLDAEARARLRKVKKVAEEPEAPTIEGPLSSASDAIPSLFGRPS